MDCRIHNLEVQDQKVRQQECHSAPKIGWIQTFNQVVQDQKVQRQVCRLHQIVPHRLQVHVHSHVQITWAPVQHLHHLKMHSVLLVKQLAVQAECLCGKASHIKPMSKARSPKLGTVQTLRKSVVVGQHLNLLLVKKKRLT